MGQLRTANNRRNRALARTLAAAKPAAPKPPITKPVAKA
jgi:hypothetical protein